MALQDLWTASLEHSQRLSCIGRMTNATVDLGDPAPLCSLSLFAGRATGSLVGRPLELAAVEQQLAAARGGMAAVTLEGEPGIGKTRLLLAIDEMARKEGFGSIAVTTDEEIRGPFLLARSIFGATDAASGPEAQEAIRRVAAVLSAVDAPAEGFSAEQKLLRTFDLATIALRTLAAERPLALLIDDLQWADEDSIRMLRYLVRTASASRIFLALAVRRDEVAFVNEAVTLLADLERMALLRRLSLNRFSQVASTEFLQQTLGGPINLTTAATMHAQAEGVPFLLGEQLRAYRDAGLLQQVDGVWTLARNAERLMPSAVRTLIQRRANHLPEGTRSLLSEAAILGRTFSLRDLHRVKALLGDPPQELDALADSLEPAVGAGFLLRHPETAAADFSFVHGQIREQAASAMPPGRSRAVHAAIVEMLTANQSPPPESLPLLAQHALAAGQTELSAQFAIEAAKLALKANAPEEALRLVDMAHPVASGPLERVEILRIRDDALDTLRRPNQRIESLAELSALAQALRDSRLELDAMLRRAAALRLSREHDRAAELARRVRDQAAEARDKETELAACLELGQDLLRIDLGEGYAQTPLEADIEAAAPAYEDAARLARELHDERRLAASLRELGIIAVSRVRAWFVALMQSGQYGAFMSRLAGGERLEDMLTGLEIEPQVEAAAGYFTEALDLYERLGDRQGAMATIIAIAFVSWGPEIHLGGSVKRIEELRRLSTRMKSLINEGERELAEAQMLFGSHVYSRAKLFPDLAITRGEEAHSAARALGDRSLEFAAAGGTAMAYAEIGSLARAEEWLSRAGEIASSEPTSYRARQLLVWRGSLRAAAGDAEEMQQLLQRAIQLAMDQGRPAARCETLALLALEAARLGAERDEETLLALAERSATEAKSLAGLLPGHPLWSAQGDAALACAAMARGAKGEALEFGRAALGAVEHAQREDVHLEILIPSAAAVLAGGGEEEVSQLRERLRVMLTIVSAHTVDQRVRADWFRTAQVRKLTAMAAFDVPESRRDDRGAGGAGLAPDDASFLGFLVQGMTNADIAQAMGTTEEAVNRKLTDIYAKMGATSRAYATTAALLGRLI